MCGNLIRMDDFLNGRQSLGDFLAGYDIDIKDVPAGIAEALAKHDLSEKTIMAWQDLAILFGRSQRATPILCLLLARDDHHQHEDITQTLQTLRDPRTVDCLFDRANRWLDYLDYNDSMALGRKCVWALHDIGTEAAIARMQSLTHDVRAHVSDSAKKKLADLAKRRPGDPPEAYRVSRDATLGPL